MEENDIKKLSPYSIIAKVVAFEGMFVKLKATNVDLEKDCLWPIKLLPENVKEGDTFYIRLGQKETLEAEYQEIARKVLDEMLN